MNEKIEQLETNTDWKALQYFNSYRIFIALFFVVLVVTKYLPEPLGEHNKNLFSLLSYIYLLFSLFALYTTQYRLLPHQLQVIFNVIIDIIILGLLMYASGGLKSGFGLLLVITVAGGSILSRRKLAIFFAAMASIMVLGLQVYTHFFEPSLSESYTPAAILGLAFFITSIAGNFLSSRLKASEALAESRALDLQNLGKLNEQIVERLQSGIIAVDKDHNIRLMNDSAKQMLAYESDDIESQMTQTLEQVSPELAQVFTDWQNNKELFSSLIRIGNNNNEIKVGMTEIGSAIEQGKNNSSQKIQLIFLDDASKMRQQAQSLKLESLGRLTASIAHEIRNPLGAISHAGQLLFESKDLAKSDSRLTEIIKTQSLRVNNIIENVMNISRRQLPSIEEIHLRTWLEKFKLDLLENVSIEAGQLEITLAPKELTVFMDSTQLYQVLWNLSQNAVRYSRSDPLLKIHCAIQESTDRPYIDVVDTGPGIDKTQEEQLFEPFFTTEKEGTGLGLYIARELCEMNQASLQLQLNSDTGCCFRIVFSHPEKQHHVIE